MIRTSLLLLALAASAAALAFPAAAAAPGTPKGTLTLEVSYLKAGQFQKVYALYTSKFHTMCPYAKWLVQAKKAQPTFKQLTLRVIKQTITGKRALLDYQFVAGSKVANTTRGDLFVKIGTGWYDEVDAVTTC